MRQRTRRACAAIAAPGTAAVRARAAAARCCAIAKGSILAATSSATMTLTMVDYRRRQGIWDFGAKKRIVHGSWVRFDFVSVVDHIETANV